MSLLVKNPDHLVALVDAKMLYPTFGVRVVLSDPENHPFNLHDDVHEIDFMIASKYEDQKQAGQQELDSLMKALKIQIPNLIKQQPPQVIAATYTRLLKQESWKGWMLSNRKEQLKLVKVKVTEGVSEHQKKTIYKYEFSSTDQVVDRKKVLINTYNEGYVWRYQPRLSPKTLASIPDDFLMWFDEKGNDRNDVTDANIVAKSLNLKNKRLLEIIFYQLKFEMADVITTSTRYGLSQPGNIFEWDSNPCHSLAGLIMIRRKLKGARPSALAILEACVNDKLPCKEWNGQWISDKKRASRNRHFN